MSEFKMVPLSEIRPDPNQPRKYFDVAAMDELVNSAREKGILQPILIRPTAGSEGYMIVCGERRYQAALSVNAVFKDRNDIPAIIRELSDEEALELQIIENLQRKDVHPLEEAVAFQSLLERKTNPLTLDQVAQRMGKRAAFVRQRLKLNALGKEWQAAFFAGLLELHNAMLVAMLAPKAQEEYAKEEDLASHIKNNRALELSDWRYKKYKGILSEATFDLSDKTLNSKAGSCTNCQFNSSVSLLFEEADHSPTCSNVSCFSHKTNIAFDRQLKIAQEESGTVLISENFYLDQKEASKFETGSHIVYSAKDYETADTPSKPDWERYRRANSSSTEIELKAGFEKEKEAYEKRLKEFEKKIAGGKYLKAFVVIGNRSKGKTIYVKLNPKSDGKTAKKLDDGNLTAADIDSEITRINEKEKRSKELDLEKVHINIVAELRKQPHFKKVGLMFNKPSDKVIMINLLLESAGYSVIKDIRKTLGIKEAPYDNKGKYLKDFYAQFENITDEQLAYIIRVIALDKYSSHLAGGVGGTALRIMAEYMTAIDISSIEKAQAEVAARRIDRVNGRIKSLNKQKEELQEKQKPPVTASKPPKKSKPAKEQ